MVYVSAASIAISEAMGKQGAIKAVVRAMKGHPHKEGVQVREKPSLRAAVLSLQSCPAF